MAKVSKVVKAQKDARVLEMLTAGNKIAVIQETLKTEFGAGMSANAIAQLRKTLPAPAPAPETVPEATSVPAVEAATNTDPQPAPASDAGSPISLAVKVAAVTGVFALLGTLGCLA